MIPNMQPDDIHAVFKEDNDEYITPIAAWDEEGYALVACLDGYLIRAVNHPDFAGMDSFKNYHPSAEAQR